MHCGQNALNAVWHKIVFSTKIIFFANVIYNIWMLGCLPYCSCSLMVPGSWSVREWLVYFCQSCWLKHHFFIVLLVRGLCAEIFFVWTFKSAELGCRWQCVSHHQCRDHIWTFVKWFGWIVVVLACFISDWSLTSQNCLLSSAETISHQIQTLPNVFCNVEFTMNKILLWLMTLHEKMLPKKNVKFSFFNFSHWH